MTLTTTNGGPPWQQWQSFDQAERAPNIKFFWHKEYSEYSKFLVWMKYCTSYILVWVKPAPDAGDRCLHHIFPHLITISPLNLTISNLATIWFQNNLIQISPQYIGIKNLARIWLISERLYSHFKKSHLWQSQRNLGLISNTKKFWDTMAFLQRIYKVHPFGSFLEYTLVGNYYSL